MRGRPGDHHRRDQLDVVDLRVPRSRSVSSSRFFSIWSSCMWKLRMPGPCRPSISLQRREEHVEPLPVVLGAEVVEAGLGPRLLVQDVGVERAVGGHQVP